MVKNPAKKKSKKPKKKPKGETKKNVISATFPFRAFPSVPLTLALELKQQSAGLRVRAPVHGHLPRLAVDAAEVHDQPQPGGERQEPDVEHARDAVL